MNRAPTKWASAKRGLSLVHVVHGVDVVEAFLIGVDVDHPAEDDGVEAAAGFGAGVFGVDGTLQAELGPVGVAELAERRNAKIGVEVPHGDAERDAGVEFVFVGALGHGVHGAYEFVAGGGFFVEQGSGARGIEGERFEEAVAIAGEVILRLGNIWQENPEALIQCDVIILIFLDARAKLRDDFPRSLHVLG